EISVLPYRRGAQNIGWAVVIADSCGEQVLAHDEKTVEVAAGSPEIVVQDRFATSTPLKRLVSAPGTHELLLFNDRYEVFELATDSRILARAGAGATFSPTGRFVTARRPADQKLEVVDLVSGEVIAETLHAGALGWARGDSYLIYTAPRGARDFAIWNAVVDGKPLLHEEMFTCMACSTRDNIHFDFDLDHGFLAVFGDLYARVVDLFTRAVEPKS